MMYPKNHFVRTAVVYATVLATLLGCWPRLLCTCSTIVTSPTAAAVEHSAGCCCQNACCQQPSASAISRSSDQAGPKPARLPKLAKGCPFCQSDSNATGISTPQHKPARFPCQKTVLFTPGFLPKAEFSYHQLLGDAGLANWLTDRPSQAGHFSGLALTDHLSPIGTALFLLLHFLRL